MKSYRKELWFEVPTRRAFVNMLRFPIVLSTARTAKHSPRIGASKKSDSRHNARDLRRKKRERRGYVNRVVAWAADGCNCSPNQAKRSV